MEETKNVKNEEIKVEKKETKGKQKGKHKSKATVGDIIFRVIIIVSIFLIAVLAYALYLQGIA